MEEKQKIILIIIALVIVVLAISQIIKILQALIPWVIILGVALIFLIALGKKETKEALKELLKKKK